jgi:hypothetical protein
MNNAYSINGRYVMGKEGNGNRNPYEGPRSNKLGRILLIVLGTCAILVVCAIVVLA